MPITSAQKKSVRKVAKRSVLNRKFKDDLNIAMALFRKKIEQGEKLTQADLDGIYKAIDKAKKKKIFHKNTAARMKSKFARKFNTITDSSSKKATSTKKKAPAKKKSTATKKTTTKKKTTSKK